MTIDLYGFDKLENLRENHRHLYHQIREYLSTLDPTGHWALEHGVFSEYDGSVVHMIFRSMRNTKLLLAVRAEQNGADYTFISHQIDETN